MNFMCPFRHEPKIANRAQKGTKPITPIRPLVVTVSVGFYQVEQVCLYVINNVFGSGIDEQYNLWNKVVRFLCPMLPIYTIHTFRCAATLRSISLVMFVVMYGATEFIRKCKQEDNVILSRIRAMEIIEFTLRCFVS